MADREGIGELITDVKEHLLYLKELGVDQLDVSLAEKSASLRAPVEKPVERYIPDTVPVKAATTAERKPSTGSGRSRLANLPSLSRQAADIVVPELPIEQGTAKPPSIVQPKPEADEIAAALKTTVDTIESIRAEIGDCTRCPLYAGRTQIVHSTGNQNAQLMFVGEAPGADEDEQGFPLVGRTGQLLTKIIEGIGISREAVFIGNINRCRPPGNRQPVPEETAACRPFLLREVAVVKPKVIVVLGNTATQNLLSIKTPISKLRGEFQDYFGVKVMPTFHPAYLLRDPHKKREVWEDMKKVRDYLNSL